MTDILLNANAYNEQCIVIYLYKFLYQ